MTTTESTMQDSKFGEHLYLTPRVPQGLAAAVEGLTREVIRHRPENIYAFAARHFENLLRLREQYDSSASNGNKRDSKLLRDINEAVRQRYDDQPKDTTDQVGKSGWSLNETAKVLEKHRSIFGDSGQKVSTEQIRELANEPVSTRLNDSSPKRKDTASPSRRRKESPLRETTSKNTTRTTPRILSQIPIAKDIKTELRKNRISSREKKKVVACEYTRETTIIEKSSKRSFEKTSKSYEMVRSEKKSSRTEDTTKKRSETKSHHNQQDKKFTRGGSMDSVKNYVVQNFVGMTSLDELQSPSYVEKVQEVIDETSSLIKEKVEALKSGVSTAKAKQMKKEMSSLSSSGEEHSKSSSNKDREGSLSRRNSEASESKSSLPAVRPQSSKSTSRSVSARSESDAALTLPPISPESAKSTKVKEELILPVLSPPRTTTSLDDADDTTAAVEEIAEDATLSSEKIDEDLVENVEDKIVDTGERVEEKVADTAESVEENVVTIGENGKAKIMTIGESVEEKVLTIGKNVEEEIVDTRESVEKKVVTIGENVEEKIVTIGESVEDKVLTIGENVEEKIVTIGERVEEKVVATEESVEEKVVASGETTDEKILIEENVDTKVEEETVVLEEKETENVNEDVVLPEEKLVPPEDKKEEIIDDKENIANDKPTIIEQIVTDEKQRSPEPKVSMDFLQVKEEEFHDSLNVTPEPFDTKGQRPDSLENSLADDNVSSGHASPVEKTLKDKLLEIEEVQKRIEDVLDDTKTTTVAVEKTDEALVCSTSKIEDKLIEIQESEKRIELILDSQSTNDTSHNSDIKNKLQELEDVERRIESIFHHETAITELKESKVEDEKSKEKETVVTKNDDILNVPTITEENPSPRAVSPHSYILSEGSPYEIPDSVTTVIIPERSPSPTGSLQVDVEDSEILSTLLTSKENNIEEDNNAFGEIVVESTESTSTVDIDYIKASHDTITSRENLDRIREEEEATEIIDSEDEKVLKVVTSSLEEILEKEEVEYVEIVKYTEQEIKLESIAAENSLISSTARSIESTNEVKETSVTTDRSSLSLDPVVPTVPELNLDSLPDLSVSSFSITDDKDTNSSKKQDSSESEMPRESQNERQIAKDEATTDASVIIVPPVDINNVVCSSSANDDDDVAKANNNDHLANQSQCTEATIASIDENAKEEFVTMDDDHEKKAYHIYVPDSKDASSSSETSTFMSAATKIQAGVRGFLTRRRLQSTQKRSSTLDSVPSIQESFVVDTINATSLMPIVESSSISEAKARKKLRREDAVQRTTLSVENAFAENQIQHTGEFHDCIPLPVFDAQALSLKSVKERQAEKVSQVEHLLEKILLSHAASNFSTHPKLVDVVLLPTDTDQLDSKYLNFITSVEDVFNDLPETPKGVIIEEITSLDEASKSSLTEAKKPEENLTTEDEVDKQPNDTEETLASISTPEDPLSINIEEVLGLGDEQDEVLQSRKTNNRLNVKLDQIRSSSISQDSPISDEQRTRSPVTMMQIVPNKSIDDKSEENPT